MLFNFTGLRDAFLEAIGRHEPTLAFTLLEGSGKFVFLLFLKTDSSGKIKWGDLELFILLARTQKMLRFKLYGNHKINGDFKIPLKADDEEAIRRELNIFGSSGGPAFDLENFLSRLNAMIPASIPLSSKIDVTRSHRDSIKQHCANYLDAASKVYLLRAVPVGEGKQPREETLRKLYMLDAAPDAIESLIRNLKKIRWTTFWTASEPDTEKFAEIFANVARIAGVKSPG